MAVNLSNTAEGGSNGTTATSGNTAGASGSSLNLITAGTGTVTFSTDIANTGVLSYKLAPGSASNCYIGWGISGSQIVAMRMYVYFTAFPTASTQFIQFGNGSVVTDIGVTNTGKFFLQDINGTITGSTGAATIPLNTWLRAELAARVGTTGTGDTSIWSSVYLRDNVSNPLYAFSTSTASSTTANVSTLRAGKVSNSGDWATMYIDDLALQDNTIVLGPAGLVSANWLYC